MKRTLSLAIVPLIAAMFTLVWTTAVLAQQPTLTATFYAAPGVTLPDGLNNATAILAPQKDGTWRGVVNGATVVFNQNPTWQSVSLGKPDREWAISVMDGSVTVGCNVSARATDLPISADFGVAVTTPTILFPAGSNGMGIRVK